MLFNSYIYLFAFLPVSIIGYFWLNRHLSSWYGRFWLVLCSLFFYSWWNVKYLPLILGSILVNYAVGERLVRHPEEHFISRKQILTAGVVFNVLLLGFFKYTDFFITNINLALGADFALPGIILPLGISFFTFTQIAYLVDAYRAQASEYSKVNYFLFVSYFPHLLAGPILHHKEMMPQFQSDENKTVNYRNMATGLFLLVIGLFEKVIIADAFAVWAIHGFDSAASLNVIEAWVSSLSYTFQLYFDFSGYTDMAIGAALMFNIKLPINFNSPYKALDIQDFWRRWHMTLSRFLREYVYIPLGGNRGTEWFVYRNLMLTFLIGGFWHGAGWNFIFWGFLHGLALVAHRFWSKKGFSMPSWLAWFLTFNYVNIAWIFFRAHTWSDAMKVLTGMFGVNGLLLPAGFQGSLAFLQKAGVQFGALNTQFVSIYQALLAIGGAVLVVLLVKNPIEFKESFQPGWKSALIISGMAVWAILSLNKVTEFLYFNF